MPHSISDEITKFSLHFCLAEGAILLSY